MKFDSLGENVMRPRYSSVAGPREFVQVNPLGDPRVGQDRVPEASVGKLAPLGDAACCRPSSTGY